LEKSFAALKNTTSNAGESLAKGITADMRCLSSWIILGFAWREIKMPVQKIVNQNIPLQLLAIHPPQEVTRAWSQALD